MRSLSVGLSRSIRARAGKSSRMSSAHSGWRFTYSVMEGASPRRCLSRNSSASRSTGLRSELEPGMKSALKGRP